MFSRYSLLGGRRRQDRRGDDEGTIVDLHGPRLFSVALVIVALNVLDAFFTLYFLGYGGKEMNPFVDQVLLLGPSWFLLYKSLGIGVCVGFLVLTKNFRISRVGMGIVVVGYTLLLAWHLYLLGHVNAGT